jgi:adenine-specific DNA-methyltransferase
MEVLKQMNKIMDKLNAMLKADAYFVDETGEVIREKVKTAALSLDEHLMSVLTDDEELKSAFFTEQNGILIFDKVQFSWFVSSSEFLPDSYTVYKNKIGLIDTDRNFIKTCDDVALSFPYKDCILEFDSTDENEDRDEVFLNERLASSEIDSLLAPKVFANAQLHDKDGKRAVESYDGQNLVIKGNNLIALYSLLPKFEGRVKLIYWDILYNTDNDNVPYNDSFKHSSWLTMMKNRIEIAKKLLTADGVFLVECDKHEDGYLRVLCDEIFGRDKFVNSITVQSSTPSGTKLAHRNKTILKTKDTILVYKNGDSIVINPQYTATDSLTNFDYWLEKEGEEYIVRRLRDVLIEQGIISRTDKLDDIKMSANKVFEKFILDNASKIFRKQPSLPPKMKAMSRKEPNKIFTYYDDEGNEFLCQNGTRFAFLSSGVRKINGEYKVSQLLCDIWTDISFHGTQYEGNVDLPAGKKPERLIKRILDMFAKPGDIILDAYLGSGTTACVAHKMGYRYIGIEQLDIHYNKSVSRLEYVVSGSDTGPVSAELGWQGGGEFVSCELAKDNLKYFELVSTLDDKSTIDLFNELLENPLVLCHTVDVKKAKENAEAFEELPLDDKKKVLISMLEKNILYVSYSDIDDEEKAITEEDKKFSRAFYGE